MTFLIAELLNSVLHFFMRTAANKVKQPLPSPSPKMESALCDNPRCLHQILIQTLAINICKVDPKIYLPKGKLS